MKKIIFILSIVVLAAGIYLFNKEFSLVKKSLNIIPDTTDISKESRAQDPVSENLITYADSGYSPAVLKIKVGATVTWKNESAGNTWPASAMHPTHDVYPVKGGCVSSIFDACKAVPPGESWSFKFDIPGEWKYHNHLNPSHFGSISVAE